jgi:quercetin dioxygenase-like cupin family protein
MGVVASTGWHTHPGHSLIIVTAGTITEYHADCKPHVYVVGDTFVDPGGGEEHILRNEGSTELASTMAVQLVPHDPLHLNRRIDAPAPESCKDIM